VLRGSPLGIHCVPIRHSIHDTIALPSVQADGRTLLLCVMVLLQLELVLVVLLVHDNRTALVQRGGADLVAC
jgi:hypothetical protein